MDFLVFQFFQIVVFAFFVFVAKTYDAKDGEIFGNITKSLNQLF